MNMQAMSDRADRRRAAGNRQPLCWQGWRLDVPATWNPVKLEGSFEQGSILLADLHRPRLGLRWTSGRRIAGDPAAWAARALREEVGRLAAQEAAEHPMPGDWRGSTLYLEPRPPGRDVWLGYSVRSGRAVQVIHHGHRRERVLSDVLLPSLRDEAAVDPRLWAVLDLSCRVPAGLALEKPLLFAGDLGLRFAAREPARRVMVRQAAPASVALKRMPLEKWLHRQQQAESKHYRPVAGGEELALAAADGRPLEGLRARLARRRRFMWKRALPAELITLALHDPQRDRLIFVQGGGDGLDLGAIAQSLGWAR